VSAGALFHLSIPVSDLARARAFYVDLLGCRVGREGERRMDIDFFGHHVVAHLAPEEAGAAVQRFHSDGADVSVRHFGAIVDEARWEALRERLEAAGVDFSMTPQTIRAGTVQEQRIMMMPDGCGNVVELKSIPPERLFAR
jgi:extradiol dioxygenase family protein